MGHLPDREKPIAASVDRLGNGQTELKLNGYGAESHLWPVLSLGKRKSFFGMYFYFKKTRSEFE